MARVLQPRSETRKRQRTATDYAAQARELFAKYLDLTPLKHRDRGVVTCVFHSDRTPSLSVDLAAGVFHCFGCGVEGGVHRFAELVGERPVAAHAGSTSPRSPMAEARRDVLLEALRQPWAHPDVRLRYELADMLRLADRLRQRMTTESAAAWDLLALAAELTTGCEALLDELGAA